MNAIKMLTVGLFLTSTMAFASDAENKAETTKDVSKNPITGTVTTTKKYSKKVKHEDGTEGEVNVKEKTKQYKDGTVKKSTDAEAESTHK